MMEYFQIRWRRLAVTLAMLWLTGQAAATDVAIMARSTNPADHRLDYAALLLQTVLERTKPQFGPYRIETANVPMNRSRLLSELRLGQAVNITPMAMDAEWVASALPVNIPIDLGLQSWRLLMVDQHNQGRLGELARSGKLWQAYAGVSTSWALYPVLTKQGYRTVTGNNYDGMFLMLQARRFDYLPRGIAEVFLEFDRLRPRYADLAIQGDVVMHVNIPTLFFVATQATRLHRRISSGMESMLRDGSLERLVLSYYRPALQRAQLCDKTVIEVPNPDLDAVMAARTALWLNPYEPRHGLCHATPHDGPAGADVTRPSSAQPAPPLQGRHGPLRKDLQAQPRIAALQK